MAKLSLQLCYNMTMTLLKSYPLSILISSILLVNSGNLIAASSSNVIVNKIEKPKPIPSLEIIRLEEENARLLKEKINIEKQYSRQQDRIAELCDKLLSKIIDKQDESQNMRKEFVKGFELLSAKFTEKSKVYYHLLSINMKKKDVFSYYKGQRELENDNLDSVVILSQSLEAQKALILSSLELLQDVEQSCSQEDSGNQLSKMNSFLVQKHSLVAKDKKALTLLLKRNYIPKFVLKTEL